MCEQTEINYLDGDIVWVKLGAYWWPGQVTGFDNLPEDIKGEFQKKPLIAAVKFFQEDTYEYVKNYQQIYKYNCTLKDEFIKKGLDKYRRGDSYMNKFPGDVEMAEKLTGGDPDILNSEKFSPEEKPDISALFGEKKVPKKKKDRDDNRRSDGADILRKITHPRFLRESDHEVRIRQQPSSLPSTPNSTVSPQYPCHMCNFTSSRVNVIICHIKSHRSGGSPVERSRVKTYSQSRSRISDVDTPKRKYVRKEKSHLAKSKVESSFESGKRKQPKQNEKATKKKKTDPEIREKLLADWDDESDEDISFDQNKSLGSDVLDISSIHDDSADNKLEEDQDRSADNTENNDILAESEKLLEETEKLTNIQMIEDSVTNRNSDSKNMDLDSEKSDSEKASKSPAKTEAVHKSHWQKEILNSDNESKSTDDKKSRLSCFDFDEDDLPEPSIPPVRKIPRVFGEKNLSLKKEIIKEFEMSQALKNEQDKETDNDRQTELKSESNEDVKSTKALKSSSEEGNEENSEHGNTIDDKMSEEEATTNKSEGAKTGMKMETESLLLTDNQQKPTGSVCETELEIVEIFEVEREDGDDECAETATKTIIEQSQSEVIDTKVSEVKTKEQNDEEKQILSANKEETVTQDTNRSKTLTESTDNTPGQDTDEALSEKFTTETEDETVSESADTLQEQSEISDLDQPDQVSTALNTNILAEGDKNSSSEKVVRKRRGRPRKTESTDSSRSSSQLEIARDKRLSAVEQMDVDRKTSESDTDRSYTGRRRKPNKKYLQSDIYDTDQRAFKTDESMSENDEKVIEKPKSKRRGRRSSKFHDSLESSDKLKDQEIELSDKLLHAVEDGDRNDQKQKLAISEDQEEKKIASLKEKLAASKDETSPQDQIEVSMEMEEIEQNKITNTAESPVIMTSSDGRSSETQSPKGMKKDAIVEAEIKNSISNEQGEIKKSSPSTSLGQVLQDADTQKAVIASKLSLEMLPPKKSQIKKFELSQNEFFDDDTLSAKSVTSCEPEKKIDKDANASLEHTRGEISEEIGKSLMEESGEVEKTAEKINLETVTKEMIVHTIIGDSLITPREILSQEKEEQQKKEEELPEKGTLESKEEERAEKITEEPVKEVTGEETHPKISMQTRYKGKYTPETGIKAKIDKHAEEKPVNTFQEAFLKTLQMDKKKAGIDDMDTLGKSKKGKKSLKKQLDESDDTSTTVSVTSPEQKDESVREKSDLEETASVVHNESTNSEIPIISSFEGMEVVTGEHIIQTKESEFVAQSAEQNNTASPDISTKQDALLQKSEEDNKSFPLGLQKTEESSKVSSPSPLSDVAVPVKKREMPRIIENVTLTEPMQILKTKLLDKIPGKSTKHKLESDAAKKCGSRAKIMKIEPTASNSKMKAGVKVTTPHMSLSKKLQVLKAEENEISSNVESQKDTLSVQTKQTVAARPIIQQISQSLSEMELDINSMPFVLSEDVLTPESIEQMPVVISSILPSSTSLPSTISFTPTTQIITTNQAQFKLAGENPPDVSPKKKSGTPAILKNKNRAKPTITSIKKLVPPLTGGVKGLKFQNAQPSKAQPVLTQKGTPGKYVVVQASGGQQLRYSVQGKPGTPQKIAIPAGKSAGNAQVVQQGGKVVILTSAQSGQTKMLPLNISKALSSKVQRIVTTRGEIFCPITPQNIIASKAIIAPKGDPGSSTTSKLPPGHKVINAQGIITSKGMLTPISGTIGKSAILGLPPGILTEGRIYTPISAPALTTKTFIGSKALVTKGTTVLSPQNLGTSKTIFTPVTQTITGKAILSSQSIVGPRGTVLTPITGQQVKAIAAKSPSKGTKVQYQPLQQKIQLPVLQKNQKVPMTTSSQGRVSSALKSTVGALVLQNTTPAQKASPLGKKIVKQAIVQQCSTVQSISAQTSAQQTTMSSSPRLQQKGRSPSASGIQKVIIPRGGGRQTKAQQKIVVQKIQEPTATVVQNVQLKQTLGSSSAVPPITKTLLQQKHHGVTSTVTVGKSPAKTQTMNKTTVQQKNVLSVALNSASATANLGLSTSLSLPALEPIEPEKVMKVDETSEESVQKEHASTAALAIEKSVETEKVVEPKVPSQPQIMALPTESTDGTQTYVLVTIDEQGQIQPLDNNTLMSLEGTTQNPDGTRTLYIDPSSLGEAGTLDNIVLQFDNGALPTVQNNVVTEASQVISESFPTSDIVQTSNQDILAAALANTDFQQEINLPENSVTNVMTTGLTQTSLINQTILQSTIIPPTEPISSPSVLETSLTLNQPIMTPLEVPSNLPIQAETTPTSVVSTIPSSLELPITITNPNISYITAGEAQIQIPGNSMPDIGEIMESPSTAEISQAEIPASTQYLVIPNLNENITVESQAVQSNAIDMPTVSYSVSIPSEIALQPTQAQTTPSMPIIDDTYAEDTQFTRTVPSTIVTEQSFIDVPVSEMLVSKASDVTASQDVAVTSEITEGSQEIAMSAEESKADAIVDKENESVSSLKDNAVPEELPTLSEEVSEQQPAALEVSTKNESTASSKMDESHEQLAIEQPAEQTAQSSSMPIIDESTPTVSELPIKVQPAEEGFEVTDSCANDSDTRQEADTVCETNPPIIAEQSEEKLPSPAPMELVQTSNQVDVAPERQEEIPAESADVMQEENMEVEEGVESAIYTAATTAQRSEDVQTNEPSSEVETNDQRIHGNVDLHMEETNTETTSQETPSQSYEQFDISMTSDSVDLPTQSATKSENSREPSQSIAYEAMETDEDVASAEPPTQSFEHSKRNEASQSYDGSAEANTNAPTQSFNEIAQSQDGSSNVDEAIDDQSFPTQSYDVGKIENIPENLETDAEISQEGNIPSQSNDIGTDCIGTSSVSTNNSGLNEDETASSSYVPETPENQERDQDQESAISTSSYEIPPCEELNIASSSVIPDTSVSAEHTSIHDNGIPEIPTSSYNLNPDITSTHVDSVPTSSYEEHVLVEQNVSTSYDVPISVPGLEETSSQNFVTESTDHRNEPSSYYAHHQEVTASYYEPVDQESNSRLERDAQAEVTASYYERNPQEASQSYFAPEEATPSYTEHSVSPSYYDHGRPESEASQSYYPADDLEKTDQSPSQNIEASQSFYQERTDDLRLRQQGEATPTYSERYPVDYTLENSPIERHDLVESSVPATRPMER